jgi:hypothetical protein
MAGTPERNLSTDTTLETVLAGAPDRRAGLAKDT